MSGKDYRITDKRWIEREGASINWAIIDDSVEEWGMIKCMNLQMRNKKINEW